MSSNRIERNKQRIRIALIEATYQLLMEKGYDNFTVTDIADVADYGRSTFYVYFKDKEDIVWHMLAHFMTVLDQQILDSVLHLESPKREWLAWRMIFHQIDLQRQFYLQLDGEMSRRLRQVQKDTLTATFERQVKDGIYSVLLDDIPPELVTRYIVGAQLEILEYWLDHPEMGDADTMAGYFYKLVFREDPPTLSS